MNRDITDRQLKYNYIKAGLLIICSLLILIFAGVVHAIQPTQQYNKILLEPFYVSSMTQNVQYNYTVNVITPDGISQIKSSILTLDAWINPTRIFNAYVNGVQCNTKNYTISTTYASAGRGVVTFDCTNAILPNRLNTVTFIVSNGNIGSSTSWLDLTYMNNPVADLTLHGTEYTFGQTSKVWLQLLNSNGSYINDAVCYTDIYYPNSSQLLERATMTNYEHDGIYFYDIVLPEVEGVYPTIALCYYTAGQTYNYATSVTIINGSISSGDVTRTYIDDGSYLTTDESVLSLGNPRRYWSEFSFNNGSICSNVSSLLLTGITIGWVGRWNSNPTSDTMSIYIYNHTSSSWILLPNTITGIGVGVKSVSNSISLSNITSMGFVNITGSNLRLKFQDTNVTDTSTNGFDYDYLYLSCDRLSSPEWQSIKGSSELHLSEKLNYTSRFDTIDSSLNNINSTMISQFNQLFINITQFYNSIISYIISVPYNVWNYNDRNLTYYPEQNVTIIDYNIISDYVWNNTGRYVYGVLI